MSSYSPVTINSPTRTHHNGNL